LRISLFLRVPAHVGTAMGAGVRIRRTRRIGTWFRKQAQHEILRLSEIVE